MARTPRKKRSLKDRKKKAARIVQLQHEDGTPLDDGEWRMDKKQAKDYDKVIGRLMQERGMTEDEAVNEMMRQGLGGLESDVTRGMSQVRTSRQQEMANQRGSMLTTLGLRGADNLIPDQRNEYADPERKHLLEPENEAELESMISQAMAKDGFTYADAREHVLTCGDRILDERHYKKLVDHYTANPDDIGPDKLELMRQDYAKMRRKNRALAASEPWFRRLKRIKKLNRSARSLLEWIGMLNEMPKWAEAHGDSPWTGKSEDDRKAQVWLASKCRIFDVDPVEAGMLVVNILEHMHQILGIDTPRDFTEDELTVLHDQTQQMGFPPNLPYPQTFVGLGTGITIEDTFFSPSETPFEAQRQLQLLGFLYDHRGCVYIIFSWGQREELRFQDVPCIAQEVLYLSEGGWEPSLGRPELQWLAVALIDTINAHRTVVLEGQRLSSKDERKVKQLARKLDLMVLPSAFYTAELRSNVYLHSIRRLAPVRAHRRAQSYRTDRRAHERCRIQRGPMPVTAAERLEHKHRKKDLVKRGYNVYEHDTPDGLDEERLMVRGLKRKQDEEWLAILAYPVRQTIVGPSEAPYVPRVDIVKRLDPVDLQGL